MKLEFQSRRLRLLIEFFPEEPLIRRYRVVPGRFEARIGRRLQRQICRRLQPDRFEEAS